MAKKKKIVGIIGVNGEKQDLTKANEITQKLPKAPNIVGSVDADGNITKYNQQVNPINSENKKLVIAPILTEEQKRQQAMEQSKVMREPMEVSMMKNNINNQIAKNIVSGGIQNDIHNMNMGHILETNDKKIDLSGKDKRGGTTPVSNYVDTGKKYGDYYYDNYETYKDVPIYENKGKYYLKTASGYQPIGRLDKNGNVKTNIDINSVENDNNNILDKTSFNKNEKIDILNKYEEDKKELEKAKKLGYKDNLTKITTQEYDNAQKTFKKLQKDYKLSDKELETYIKNGELPVKKLAIYGDSMNAIKQEADQYRLKLDMGKIKQYDQKGFDISKQIYMDTNNMSDDEKQQYISYITGKKDPTQKSESSFFKTPLAFVDGYQFGDINKTVEGTFKNAGNTLVRGALNLGEGMLDTGENILGSAAEYRGDAKGETKKDVKIFNNNTWYTGYKKGNQNYWYDAKNDLLYDEDWNLIPSFNLDRFEKRYNYSDSMAEFGRKLKVHSNEEITDRFMKDFLNDDMYRRESVLGTKSEAMLESMGQALPLMGAGATVGGLYGEGAAVATTSGLTFASTYGNAKTEAIRNGATEKEAMQTAFVQATAETISEQFFDAIPGAKSAGWGEKLVGKVGNSVEKYMGSKTAKIVTKALDISGEGFEEIISNMLTAGGNDIVHFIDKDFNYGMENQSGNILDDMTKAMTSQDSMDSFISAIITSAILNAGSSKINSSKENQIINEIVRTYAKEYNMSIDEAKSRLKINGDNVEFDTRNINQTQNTPNLPKNSVVEPQNINNNINSQIGENVQNSMPTIENNTQELNNSSFSLKEQVEIARNEFMDSKEKYGFNEKTKELQKKYDKLLTKLNQAENNIQKDTRPQIEKDVDRIVNDILRTMEQDIIDDQFIDENIEETKYYKDNYIDRTDEDILDELGIDQDEAERRNRELTDEIYDKLMDKLKNEGISRRYDKNGAAIYDRQELAIKGYNELLNYLDDKNINYEVSRSTEAGYVPSIYIKNSDGEVILRIANHRNHNLSDYDIQVDDKYNKMFDDRDYANWKERIIPKIKENFEKFEYYENIEEIAEKMYNKNEVETNENIEEEIKENHSKTNNKDFNTHQKYKNGIEELDNSSFSNEKNISNKQIAPINPNAITNQNKVKPPIAQKYQKNTIEEKIEKSDNVIRVQAEEIANQLNNGKPLNTKERRWIETSIQSDVLKEKIFKEDLDVHKINYEVQSNKKSLKQANNKIDLLGYDGSINYVNDLINNGRIPTAVDVAIAQRTLQEAVKKRDTEVAQNLLMDVAILGTELGQATQALSMIGRLTPEGQLKLYSKIVHRAKMMGDKSFQNVEITPEMVEMILNAYDKNGNYNQDDLNARVEKFKQEIADQLKSSVEEKIDAWRYLAMLGNPKTHIRNIVSNIAMKYTVKFKNAIARSIETVALREKPINTRTKTWKKSSEVVKEYARNTATEMKNVITGESKYGEKASLESKKRIFKLAPLEAMSNFNSNLLEAEDWYFSKSAFINTFEEYLTANGIKTMEDIKNNPEIVEKGKEYSVKQAEIATFRQYSKLANWINKAERNSKFLKYPIKATMPFKKTPINVAKTGLSYSPAALLFRTPYDIYQLKKGNINASQFIDNLSQSISGTSLALIGYALSKAGILTGALGNDKDDKYLSDLGKQGYSIKIGNKYYSLSWLSPVAMPLFVGANFHEQLEEREGWDMNVLSDALAKTLDPLSEMSFVSSLTDALNSYGETNDKIKGMEESVIQSYVGQFFPTLFSQFASVGDDTKRSTKVSGNSSYKFGEQTVRSIMYKIPGLRNQLEPSTDIWGKEIKQNENIVMRALESFILPYNAKEYKNSNIDKELLTVYRKVGKSEIIPGFPRNYVQYHDKRYNMSAKEYTKYKKTYGTSANTMFNMLMNTSNYKNSTDKRKTRMIKKIYDYSRDIAKEEFLSNRKIDYDIKNFKYDKKDYQRIVNYITSSTQYKDDD